MSSAILIKNGIVVNEGRQEVNDILVNPPFIHRIDRDISDANAMTIDAEGKFIIPGIIDDQVHFREPGLTHKGDIASESRAAVAGGITSFMEMPNTNPQTLTQELLEEKYLIGAARSWANFSFYMGVSNDNLPEVVKTDRQKVCGIKVFLGASTGNMLVDDPRVLEKLFSQAPTLIAAHCESEEVIKNNLEEAKKKYGAAIPVWMHPQIRSDEACYLSSSFAVALAKKNGAHLHILHLSTGRELDLFLNNIPLADKKITAEVCVHHLWFDDGDYAEKGMLIKWNPAIKTSADRAALFSGILDGRIDVIATDHAPHTMDEKDYPYLKCPSGGPLVQHSLPAMMEFYKEGRMGIEIIVEKMCHNPAELFRIDRRGYIREGYYADLAIVDPARSWVVDKSNILYKCGWSPFEGQTFSSSITHTFVSGNMIFKEGVFSEFKPGMRLLFSR